MSKNYTVQPGDTLKKIAAKHGFSGYREIYDHPSNTAFRAKRPNPNVILPGDVIVIPDLVTPEKEGTGKEFDIDFKLLPPKLQMQLWVLALDANTSKVNLAYRSSISAGQQISKYGENSNRFGAGLRLNYTPQTGLTIYGGAQLRF